jgi:hypothetical protein
MRREMKRKKRYYEEGLFDQVPNVFVGELDPWAIEAITLTQVSW